MTTHSTQAVIWGSETRENPVGPVGPSEAMYSEIIVNPAELPASDITIQSSHTFEIDWGDGNFVIANELGGLQAYGTAVAPGPVIIKSNEQVDWVDFNPSNNFYITSIDMINSSTINDMSSCLDWLQDLETFTMADASNVTTFADTFYHCDVLLAPTFGTNVSTGITSTCTDFTNMFKDSGLTSLPLIDTSGSKLFASMFSGCGDLVCLGGIDTETAVLAVPGGFDATLMFNGCALLVAPDGAEQLALTTADVYVNPGACP